MTSSPDEIEAMISTIGKEASGIRNEALKLSWYMRGGISYEQALQLSYEERMSINDLIKDNLETTKKSGLPFF